MIAETQALRILSHKEESLVHDSKRVTHFPSDPRSIQITNKMQEKSSGMELF